jgi:hypothetical protein
VDFSAEAVRPKSANTIPITRHFVMDYLVSRWGNEIAEEIRPLEIQRWLLALHKDNGLAWTTVSKIPKQLDGEQGQGGPQDRARLAASLAHPDHIGLVHAGGRRRNTGSARGVPKRHGTGWKMIQ